MAQAVKDAPTVGRPLPSPPSTLADLRGLYEEPARVGAGVPSETMERVLAQARLAFGVEEATILLAGARAPLGGGVLLRFEEASKLLAPVERANAEGQPFLLLPLKVPLLPSGRGAVRTFGVLAVPATSVTRRLGPAFAPHVASQLVADALGSAANADALTGLLTRAAFSRLMPSVAQGIAEGGRVSLLMLDVDDMREVNASRGYAGGDELLRTVSSALRGELREGAFACRYGGDELVLLLREDMEVARSVAARVAETIGAASALGPRSPSVSIGVACGPEHGETGEDLVFRADQALSWAKESGKGRVVVWSPDLRQGRRRDRLAGILTGDQARDYRNVEALLESVKAVSRLAPLQETLVEVVDRCVDVAGAERGLLLLRHEGSWSVRLGRMRGGAPLEGDPEFAVSVAAAALTAGQAVFRLSREGGISPSAEVLGLKAVLCAPLAGEDVPEGVVYVDARASVGSFDRPTIAFFGALTAEISTALRNVALYERLLQRARRLEADVAERERELAQVKLLWARDRSASLSTGVGYEGIVGASPAIRETFSLLKGLEGSHATVLIEGESGTGKELVAQAIHRRSPRRAGPFVAESCAAVAEGIFERELFGHVRGAFTGATEDQLGLIEAASGGTLFLDEVGELPISSQAKLLRVLQEGELRRVGDTKVRSVDVRIVTATNRDLRAMVASGEFREDLYYRLAVFRIVLPPLRERPGDIPLLVDHLLEDLRKSRGISPAGVSREAREALVSRAWRGNVRELRNVLERAATLAGDQVIEPRHLEAETIDAAGDEFGALFDLPLPAAKNSFAVIYARRMLEQSGGSITAVARKAGVSRQTIYRLLGDAGARTAAGKSDAASS